MPRVWAGLCLCATLEPEHPKPGEARRKFEIAPGATRTLRIATADLTTEIRVHAVRVEAGKRP